MGEPAIVMGDKITGQCPNHLIPNPASGAPQPTPSPLPFSSPLLENLVQTVLIHGKPAAVMGSWGVNTPPHVGLHPADPYMAPPMEIGRVVNGSATVMFGGQPAANKVSPCTCCVVPGQLVNTVTDVLIG
jgi:uncharacterized Zn-binding protein involved in type VI secretion